MIIIFSLFFADAVDIEFQGIEPKIVLVGSNVTFRWRYTGDKKPTITEFNVVKGSSKEILVYYGFGFGGTPLPYPAVINKYATAAVFVGNTSKNEFVFMLVEVKEFSHGKNFSLHIEYESVIREDAYTEELFISGCYFHFSFEFTFSLVEHHEILADRFTGLHFSDILFCNH